MPFCVVFYSNAMLILIPTGLIIHLPKFYATKNAITYVTVKKIAITNNNRSIKCLIFTRLNILEKKKKR